MNKKKASIIISIVIVALAIGIGIYRFSSKNKLAEDNKVLSENSEIEDSDKDDNEVKEESTDQSKEDPKDEDLAKEEEQKKAEEDDKKTEEEKKVQEQQLTQQTTHQTNNTNTNTGSTNNSSGGEAQQPSTAAQQAITPPTPVKKDSYWNDSLAQQAVEIFESYNASTNNYTTDNRSYDQATYNSYYSIAESFKDGNISSDTAKSQINKVVFEKVGMKFHHTDISVGKIEVSSIASAKDITNAVAMQGSGSNFTYIKVYYNGDKDKNIIYYVRSGSALPI